MSARINLAELGTSALAFLYWWRRELRSVVPRYIRDSGHRKSIALTIKTDTVEIVQERRWGSRTFGSATLSDDRAVAALIRRTGRILKARSARLGLRLMRDQCLVRRVVMPIVAGPRLQTMIDLEVERILPRRASDVVYAWAIADEVEDEGRVPIDLIIVKRSVLDDALARLAELRLRPDFVDCWRDAKSSYRVDLLRSAAGSGASSSVWWRIRTSLAATSFALLMAAPLLWSLHRGDVLSAVEARAQLARAALQEARAEAETSSVLDSAVASLQLRRSTRPLVVATWAELVRLLPDDAYAEEVTLADRQITIIGRAKAAAALIPALELSPMFKEAGLSSSVVLDAESGLEQFTIRLVLEPGTETAAVGRDGAIQ